jgi:hypothetical protein
VFQAMRLNKDRENRDFCSSMVVEYTKPPGAPSDEVAMVCGLFDGTGIMMEWERPISACVPFSIFYISVSRHALFDAQ